MKHYKASFKGSRSPQEIEAAVGRSGALVTRIEETKGETHVYFAGGEEHGKHLRDLGAGQPSEVREDEAGKIG